MKLCCYKHGTYTLLVVKHTLLKSEIRQKNIEFVFIMISHKRRCTIQIIYSLNSSFIIIIGSLAWVLKSRPLRFLVWFYHNILFWWELCFNTPHSRALIRLRTPGIVHATMSIIDSEHVNGNRAGDQSRILQVLTGTYGCVNFISQKEPFRM